MHPKVFLFLFLSAACNALYPRENLKVHHIRQNAVGRDTDLGPVTDFQCPEGTTIAPHPDHCELYYLCYENIVHLWQCSDNLVFDLVYNGCNYDFLTDCGSRPPPFKCPSDGSFPLQPEACESKYFKCVNGVHTVETCPNGQVFDNVALTCVAATSCSGKTTTPPPPTAPGPFECPELSGLFPSPYTCTQFYSCQAGIPTLFNCPTGTYYNPDIQQCDFPSNVPQCTGLNH